MKTLLSIILIAAIVLPATAQTPYEIRIVDARHFKEPKRDLKNKENRATLLADFAQHKHHDVSVYRHSDNYVVSYYQLERDTVRNYGFNIEATDQGYDHAQYTWKNDTLNIYFFSGTSKSQVHRGHGHDGWSSIIVDQ